MCDVHGRVIGGTMTNLFVFHRARLATPSLAACGIQGTVRGLVLEHAGRFGLTVVERELGIQDIEGAEGLFLTNAVIGVWTVRLLGQRRYDVHRLPLEFLDWVRIAVHQPDPEA
jgi:4-amino-4-deoxychorismate lyase